MKTEELYLLVRNAYDGKYITGEGIPNILYVAHVVKGALDKEKRKVSFEEYLELIENNYSNIVGA